MGRWANKYVIGLTGNIGMGKSVVLRMLEHLGAFTIDADNLAHQTMMPGAPAYHPVIEQFGKWILDSDGRINRGRLGAIVFSHPEALALLESITHPIVQRGIDALITRAKQPIAVVEAIKLVEGPLGAQVDSIWVVDSAPQIQIQRLMEKRRMSEPEARRRIEAQNPQREKLARADVVISNNTNLPDLWVQVERDWKKLLQAQSIKEDDAEAPSMPAASLPPSSQAILRRPPTQTVPQVTATPPQSKPVPTPAVRPPSTQVPTPAASTPPKSQPVMPAPQPTQPARSTQTAAAVNPTTTAPVQPPRPPQPGPQTGAQPAVVTTRRGMPKTAEQIAAFINRVAGKNITRADVMGLFGEKSYMIADAGTHMVGLAGFQVENLITRVDEFLIIPGAPLAPIASKLLVEVEEASKALQSEVGFFYLPSNAPVQLVQAFKENGYIQTTLEEIKVPAWREAAAESQPPDTLILAKKLRAERVLKPL